MATHLLPRTRIPTQVHASSEEAVRHLARQVESLIRRKNGEGQHAVLGLPTGSTPVGLYRELIRLHREEGLDFSKVITFNLDEYYPISPVDPHSYNRWMHETFFDHVNIPKENIHIPKGDTPSGSVEDYCLRYEREIQKAGGIDLQILGIGRTGHIAFNEPGSSRHSRTRRVTLDPVTRRDAASGFFGQENVPSMALTMGVGSILEARQVVLLAFGEHKASIVRKAVEEPITEAITASFLQEHQGAIFLIDQAAASQLTALRRPWACGPVEWAPQLIRRAVIDLALSTGKGLLKLGDEDFREHDLHSLVREHGPASSICQRVFDHLNATLCQKPAGDSQKSVIVFSPHPDDDVISMGGTIIRLADQGHKVFIAYMTSGNIAVFDHDAWRFADFVGEFNRLFSIDPTKTAEVASRVDQFLKSKSPGQSDSDDVLKIKGLIRTTEARAGALACGVPPENLEFMDLRFYRTGTIAKAPIHPQDIQDIATLLEKVKPSQIYVAGELSDPHGTHRMCAEAIYSAVRKVSGSGTEFETWLYRGAWEEWAPHEIEKAVPLSPEVVERKKNAIFRHQSQKDKAMFPGGIDAREFWQRAEDRNKSTANTFDQLGLPEYYALEGFVLWRDGR